MHSEENIQKAKQLLEIWMNPRESFGAAIALLMRAVETLHKIIV